MRLGIGDRDCESILGIGDWALGFRIWIGIGDLDWGLGLGIWDWELGIGIGDGELGLEIRIGDWDC